MRIDVGFTHGGQRHSLGVEVRESTLKASPVAVVVGAKSYRNVGGRPFLPSDLARLNSRHFVSADDADFLRRVAGVRSVSTAFPFHDPFGRFGGGLQNHATLEAKEARIREVASRLLLLDGHLHAESPVPRLCVDFDRGTARLCDGSKPFPGHFNLDHANVVRGILSDLWPDRAPAIPDFELRDVAVLAAPMDTSEVEEWAARTAFENRMKRAHSHAREVVRVAFHGRIRVPSAASSASLRVSEAVRSRDPDALSISLREFLPHLDGEALRLCEGAIHAAEAIRPLEEADILALA